jgi:RNA polymerase sigma-70 factor (ECF subfamily)
LDLNQLINDCQKNDRKAQEQLYQLYASKLFAVCLKYSRNYIEAQDNLQDGFLLIFNKIEQFSFKGSFEGWLKRVMINHVLQQYRTQTFLSLVNENIPDDVEIEMDDDELSLDFLLKIRTRPVKFTSFIVFSSAVYLNTLNAFENKVKCIVMYIHT